MEKINWKELFPGRWSGIIFLSYMALFINQGIVVTWSQREHQYDYNIVMVVLMTEVIKLIASVILYCKGNPVVHLFQEIIKYKKVLLSYMIPAFLYCCYNNLAFVNLAAFDPTTYYVLLQFRVVITGIIFQFVFKKVLSTKQWFSLLLLTIGCMVKHINLDLNIGNLIPKFGLSQNIIYIIIQTFCSCMAGVYNEYLLKEQGASVNVLLQNVFMYINSIICNILVLFCMNSADSNFYNMFKLSSLNVFTQPKVVLIMLNNAAIGIITSFFLKNLNSILKTFASALELIFTAILCRIIFSIPIELNTVISISIVSYAVILYSQNPVQNAQPKDVEGKSLLV